MTDAEPEPKYPPLPPEVRRRVHEILGRAAQRILRERIDVWDKYQRGVALTEREAETLEQMLSEGIHFQPD
jgi:hypothetical protein